MNLYLVFAIAAIVGLVGTLLMILSLVSANRRGQRLGGSFWAKKELLTPRELRQNRLGFALAIAGIVGLASLLWFTGLPLA